MGQEVQLNCPTERAHSNFRARASNIRPSHLLHEDWHANSGDTAIKDFEGGSQVAN